MFGRLVVYSYAAVFCLWCPETYLILKISFPAHMLQSCYYITKKVDILGHRAKELKKIKAAGLKLQWTTPLTAEEVGKLGIKHFESFKA